MQLTCPSCGRKHRSEKYKGQFDIACPCGYSILLPDEEALAAESVAAVPAEIPAEVQELGFSAVPAAIEEEDQNLKLPVEAPVELPPASNEMTPPDELPHGMVYDPFELGPRTDASPVMAADPEPSLSEPHFEDSAAVASSQEVETPLQSLVSRTQVASLGQLLGPRFDLNISQLDLTAWKGVVAAVLKLIEERAWLKKWMEEHQISLEDLEVPSSLTGLPELVAVEIYIQVVQNGGGCEFQLSQET